MSKTAKLGLKSYSVRSSMSLVEVIVSLDTPRTKSNKIQSIPVLFFPQLSFPNTLLLHSEPYLSVSKQSKPTSSQFTMSSTSCLLRWMKPFLRAAPVTQTFTNPLSEKTTASFQASRFIIVLMAFCIMGCRSSRHSKVAQSCTMLSLLSPHTHTRMYLLCMCAHAQLSSVPPHYYSLQLRVKGWTTQHTHVFENVYGLALCPEFIMVCMVQHWNTVFPVRPELI